MDIANWAPIVAGVLLILICTFDLYSKKAISPLGAGMGALGALVLAVPGLQNFELRGSSISVKAVTVVKNQVETQGADFRRDLQDIKLLLEEVLRVSGKKPETSKELQASAQNRNSRVIIVRAADKKLLAERMESELLKRGYAAYDIFSDFSELSPSRVGKSGTVRFVFTEQTKEIANRIKFELKPLLVSTIAIQDDVRTQMSVDVRILLF